MKVIGRPPLRQRRRRAWRRALLTLAIVIAAGLGALVLYGREIATRVLTVALENAGVPPDRIEIRQFGLTAIELGPVQLGGPDGPAVSGIEAGWSLPSLIGGRLAFLRLEGLRAHARVDDGAFTIRGLPQGEGAGRPIALPIDRLEIAGAQIDVNAGAIKIVAAADATLSGSASDIRGSGRIDARVTGAGPDPIHIVASLPQAQLRPRADGMDISLTGANVALPDYDAELSAVDATASTGAALVLKLTAELNDRAAARRIAPLRLALDGARDNDLLKMSGTIASVDKALDIKLTGQHALAAKHGTLEISAAPLIFEADGRQPADLFPIVGAQLQRVSGTLSARGQLGWGAALTSKADIVVKDFAFESAVTRLSDLDGTLALASVLPPRTAGSQHFTAKLQVAGLPDGAVDLRFTLPGDNRLRIDKGSFSLAGGSLELANITLGQGQAVAGELGIRGLDLATLLGVIDVDGLSGSGTIDGRIPVRVDDSGVAILAGRLGSKGPGIVRYTGTALPDTGGGANDSIKLVRQALSDFHYTEMTLTLDRGTGGDGSLLVNLKGSNPVVLDNHPFVFNIKLETNFDKLATILLSGYAAAEGLMRGAVSR
jgi:hypothetical protein